MLGINLDLNKKSELKGKFFTFCFTNINVILILSNLLNLHALYSSWSCFQMMNRLCYYSFLLAKYLN